MRVNAYKVSMQQKWIIDRDVWYIFSIESIYCLVFAVISLLKKQKNFCKKNLPDFFFTYQKPTLFSCLIEFVAGFDEWRDCADNAILKGQCVKFSKFNHRFNGSNGLRIWNFKKFDRRIRSQMSKIGCARAVRLRQRAFSPVFALSAIPIYTQVCNIKGQISARVQLYNPQTTSL